MENKNNYFSETIKWLDNEVTKVELNHESIQGFKALDDLENHLNAVEYNKLPASYAYKNMCIGRNVYVEIKETADNKFFEWVKNKSDRFVDKVMFFVLLDHSNKEFDYLNDLRKTFFDNEMELWYKKANEHIQQDNLTKALKVLYDRENPYIEVKF